MGQVPMTTNASVRREPVPERKLRLFGADGTFLMRIDIAQSDELLAAGLAEWRGRDLRMIFLDSPVRRGLDGLHTVKHSEGVKNCRGFAHGIVPAEGGR